MSRVVKRRGDVSTESTKSHYYAHTNSTGINLICGKWVLLVPRLVARRVREFSEVWKVCIIKDITN